jgi:hypothetical protein
MVRNRDDVLHAVDQHHERLAALGVRRIGLFGSVARGETAPGSDLDFVVELHPKTFDAYLDVKEFLENLFAARIDLVLTDAIKPRLRRTILDEAVYAPGF